MQIESKKQVTNKRYLCAGKDCNKIAKNALKIIYLNKKGWFCDNCADELIRKGLVCT